MKKKVEKENLICAYCRFASPITGTSNMICSKKGVVPCEYSCRSYIYDPLKRMPHRPPTLPIPEHLELD